MRIVYLSCDFGVPVYGHKGASIHVREMCQALHALEHEVVIVSPRRGGDPPSGFHVPLRDIGPDPHEQLMSDLTRDDSSPSAAGEIRSMLYASSLSHRILPELSRFRPHVVYERYSLFGVAGVALARRLAVPLILEVNAPLSQEHAVYRRLAFAETARGVERVVLQAADRVIAVSHELRQWLLGLGVESERVAVVPNAVNAARFDVVTGVRDEIRGRLGVEGQQVIGFVGGLKPWHDTETLIRAVGILRRRGLATRLLVVGDGPGRQPLAEQAHREGVGDATIFAGGLPHDRVPAYIAAMDLAVAPYGATDNFYFSPLKLFEYMAAGRPVVAAAVGQLRQTIRHGETGWLYPPGDASGLADAIGSLLVDPPRARALGEAGREYVRVRHTWAGNARTVLGLAQSVLRERAQ